VTHPSKSKTRSVAAIGYGCVIPAKAEIHFATAQKPMDSRFRGNDGAEGGAVLHPSRSKTRSVAAIGNSRVIPAKAGIHFDVHGRNMDSRFRGNDGVMLLREWRTV
jgi:hypothetical protein